MTDAKFFDRRAGGSACTHLRRSRARAAASWAEQVRHREPAERVENGGALSSHRCFVFVERFLEQGTPPAGAASEILLLREVVDLDGSCAQFFGAQQYGV